MECDIVLLSPGLSVQGLKVPNSRSTVRDFFVKGVYLNTLLYSSCFVRFFQLFQPCVHGRDRMHFIQSFTLSFTINN